MSSVTMLRHNNIYKRCLEILNKSCLKRLRLSALVLMLMFDVVEIDADVDFNVVGDHDVNDDVGVDLYFDVDVGVLLMLMLC